VVCIRVGTRLGGHGRGKAWWCGRRRRSTPHDAFVQDDVMKNCADLWGKEDIKLKHAREAMQ
jgi:hypothetical protein